MYSNKIIKIVKIIKIRVDRCDEQFLIDFVGFCHASQLITHNIIIHA